MPNDDTGGEVKRLSVLPPVGTEDRQPALANHVDVNGGTDVVTIDFYYVSTNTYTRALDKDPGVGVDRIGDRAIIRSDPVGRVALPMTVALDMMAQMIETAVDGAGEVQDAVNGFATRMTAAMAKAQKLSKGASGG